MQSDNNKSHILGSKSNCRCFDSRSALALNFYAAIAIDMMSMKQSQTFRENSRETSATAIDDDSFSTHFDSILVTLTTSQYR